MIIKESKFLQESINQYLIFESRQILLENIKNNPRQYFIINEDYKKYCTEEEWKVIEEGIWDTITGVAGSIGDYFKESPRQGIQVVADIVSIFDPTGLVDLVNGIFYYYFKDYFSAFFSFLGAGLTMGGLLLTATGGGAVAGIPAEVAGKAVQATKVAVKTGHVAETAAKEIGVAAKVAAPAMSKIAKTVENIPFVGGISKWLTKSTDNVAALASKETSTIADVSKAVGGSKTEIANNPVVKSFTSKVVDTVKSQGFKPSKMQLGFAGLGGYGLWMQADEATLRKIAIAQLQDAFKKEGVEFNKDSKNAELYINSTIKKLDKERRNCKSEEECKTKFEAFVEKYPSSLKVLQGLKKFGDYGAELIKPSNA